MTRNLSNSIVKKIIMNGDILSEYPDAIVPVNYDRPDLNLFEGRKLKGIWPDKVLVRVKGGFLIDYVKGIVDPMVSGRASNVIEGIAGSDIEFLPITLVDESTNTILSDDYWILNPLIIVDALDWNETTWNPSKSTTNQPNFDDPIIHLRVIKPVLKYSLISDLDIFRIRVGRKVTHDIFMSNDLVQELQKDQADLGMYFATVNVNLEG